MTIYKHIAAILLPIACAALLLFFRHVDPTQARYPIQCPWHTLTGTQCPACGMQRALHELALGNFAEALSYNYFFVISIPLILAVVVATLYNYNHIFDKLKAFVYHHTTLYTYVILFFVWWIVRNIFNI